MAKKINLPKKQPAAAPALPPAAAPAAPAQQPADTSQIAPRDDRVLLRRLDAGHAANGVLQELISQVDDGALVSKGAKAAPSSQKYVLATVEQVGPGGTNEDGSPKPMELQPGNIVLVDGYSFDPGSNFALVGEGSVKATIHEQPDQTQQQPQVTPGQPGMPQLPPQPPQAQ